MKFIVAFIALVAVVGAFPSPQESGAYILSNESDNIGVGDFQARYATSNGITADESGHLQQGPNGPFVTKSGSFSYVWEGVTYTVNYVADENGFHPSGDHIPKAL